MENDNHSDWPRRIEAEFLGTSAAARELGISEQSVRIWERSGKLPATRTTTGRRLFRMVDIDAVKRVRRQADKLKREREAKAAK
jgi:predicted site-specific integrase-resolvase